MQSCIPFHASELLCHSKLSRTMVDLEGCQIHCKNCFSFLMPVSASLYHMGIHSSNTQFVKNYLVLENYKYERVLIASSEKFMSKDSIEQPFHLMYLIPIKCLKCNFEVGFYFKTVNISGTKWLLKKIAIDLELISLSLVRHNPAIKQAFIKYLIDSAKECRFNFGQWQNFDLKRAQFECQEDQLQMLLLEKTSLSRSQNQQKINQLKAVLKSMSFFENRIGNLLQISYRVTQKSEDVTRKIKQHIPKLKGFVGQTCIIQKKQSKQSKH